MNNQQGFSLLEMVIAFAILALSLGILLNIFSGGVQTALIAEEYSAAVQIAESLLAAAGVERPLQVGQTSGQENEKYGWRVEVSPFQFNPENIEPKSMTVELFKVRVTVYWDDGNGSDGRQIVLTTLKSANKVNEP